MTTETRTTLQNVATKLAEAFTQDNPRKVYALKDGAPEWMSDAVHAAHGDRLPDDWVYEHASHIASEIASRLESDPDADLDDDRSEIVDGLVDIYTSDLTSWLNGSVLRPGYVDEAVEELGGGENMDETKRLMLGQYWELDQIFGALWDAIQHEAEQHDEQVGS